MAGNGKNGKNGRRRRRWIWVTVVLIAICGTFFGLKAAFKPNHQIDPSKLAKVERGDIARSVVATGKIQPRSKVDVKSKASGIIKKLLVDYGEFVHQGQVLAELDKEELQARLREAKAVLLAAQASEESSQATFERNKVEAEGPDLPFLKIAMERARKLHQDGLIAKSVLEDADKAYQLALNKQMIALRNLAVARADMARSKAQVAQARAGLERAEEDLRNSTIVSPMDGLVLSRPVEVGDVYVLGKVDQADIGRVYMGQRARIVVESFKDRKFEGQVTKISPLGVEKDNVTTFEVRVSIRNPGGQLKANMSANAEIIMEEKHKVLLVAESAILYDKDRKPSVEIPAPESKTGRDKVALQIGISNGVKTELMAGLKEGQQVILQ